MSCIPDGGDFPIPEPPEQRKALFKCPSPQVAQHGVAQMQASGIVLPQPGEEPVSTRNNFNVVKTIREYPVKWGALSNLLFVPAAAAFVDVVYTRIQTGEAPGRSMLAAGAMAGLLAILRVAQHYFKSKDPAIVPSIVA